MIIEYYSHDDTHGNCLRLISTNEAEKMRLYDFSTGLRFGDAIRFRPSIEDSQITLWPDCYSSHDSCSLIIRVTDAESSLALLELINGLLVINAPRFFESEYEREYRQLWYVGFSDETQTMLEFAHV